VKVREATAMDPSPYGRRDNGGNQGGSFPAWQLTALVLALLIAWYILAPVFLQKPGSKSTWCRSNLKELATALAMYAQDADERMPLATSWADGLDAYVHNSGAFVCPERQQRPSSYACNRLLHAMRLDDISADYAQPALFESSFRHWNASGKLATFVRPHNGIGNIAFADGHVKAVRRAPAADAGLKRKPGTLPSSTASEY
jgi:prepilin-type processing-associated H-X9-DG protein